jgi:hypothetical protein
MPRQKLWNRSGHGWLLRLAVAKSAGAWIIVKPNWAWPTQDVTNPSWISNYSVETTPKMNPAGGYEAKLNRCRVKGRDERGGLIL